MTPDELTRLLRSNPDLAAANEADPFADINRDLYGPAAGETSKGLKPAERLERQLRYLGYPEPVKEHEFHPERRWRFDYCYPDRMLAIEVDGGVWTQGRHTRGKGYSEDCVKLNEALLLGWRVLRVTPEHVDNGSAIRWIKQAMEAE